VVVTLCNGKGGSGKTTVSVLLALALAEAGRRVGVSDRDPQGTASLWLSDLANEGGPYVVKSGESYDVVLIDTPPRLDAPQVRDAIIEADKVLLVSSPSPADLWTTRQSVEVIKAYLGKKHPARVMWNQVQPGTVLTRDVDSMSEKLGMRSLKNTLHRRQCYQHAAVLGWPGLTTAAKEEVMKLALEIVSL